MSNTDDSNKTINKSHVLTIASEDTSLSNEIIGEINFKAPIENTSKNKPHNFTTSSIQVKAEDSFCINNVGGSWTYDYTGGTSEKLWTTSEPHGLVIGDTIIFNKLGENVLGYKPDTVYYVIGTVTETTLRLSLTSGGNPVDNLVVWLKFDNNNTDTQGNTVTETGTLTYLSTSGNYKRGTHSTEFDSGDYLAIANPSQDLSGALTISLWLYPNSLPAGTVFLEKGYTDEFDLATINRKIRIHYGATGTYVYYTTIDDVLTVNTWTHIGITRDSSTSAPKIYIDGLLQNHSFASSSGFAQVSSSSYPIYVGQRRNIGSTVYQYTGYMDDLRIFNTVLTHNQIYQIYSETNYIELDTKNNEKYYAHQAVGGEWSYTDITPSQTWTSSIAHNLVQNNTVVFTRVGTGGKGYHANTEYYVKEVPTTTSAKLSLTSGGDVVEGTYNTEKYTSNLAGWWKMDGNVNDSSGNGYHGTNNGATLTTNWYGELNKAYSFNGSSNYITTNFPTSTFMGTNSFTISIWVKSVYTSGNNARCIFSTREFGNGNSGISLFAPGYVRADNNVVMDIRQDNVAVNSPNNVISSNNWSHIVYVHTSSEQKLYIDNKLSVTTTHSIDFTATMLSTPTIGREKHGTSSYGYYFNGSIGDFRIYNITLTERQVKDIYDEPPSVIKWQLTKTSLNAEMIFNTNNSKSTSEKLKIDKDSDSQFTGNITIQDKGEIVSHSDLVGWWKLDGNVNDSSGNSYNGTYNGGTAVYVHNYENVANKALNFDGTDDYITLSSFPSQIPTGSSLFSISVWIKPHVHNGSSCIIGWGVSSDSNSNTLRLEGTTQIRHFFHGSNLGYDIITTTGDLSNKFSHLVVTYNGTNRIIYMNGTQIDSDTPPTPNVTNQNFLIGRRSDSSTEYFNGYIADIRIYNRALTSAEVFNIYSPSNLITQGVITGTDKKLPVVHYKFDKDIDYKSVSDSVPTDNLVVWFKFDESSGTTANDSSGNDNHGTLGDGSNSSTYPTLTATGYDGTVNGAYSFDGTDDYIDLSSHGNALADFSNGFSFTGWIKWTSLTNDNWSRVFILSGDSLNNKIIFYQNDNTNGLLLGIHNGGNTAYVLASNYIDLNTWTYVAVTFNNSTREVKIYKNGILVITDTLNYSIPNSTRNNSNIGRDPDGTEYFQGSMDDFRIYNIVLTSNQILNIVNQPPITIPTPVVWMKFNNKLHDEQNNSVTETGDVTFDTIEKRFGTHSAYFTSGDYLTIANPSQDLSGALTITVWVYVTSNTTAYTIIEKGYYNEFEIMLNTDSTITIFYGTTSGGTAHVYYKPSFTVPTNTWFHLTVSRGSQTSTPLVYINGILTSYTSNVSGGGTSQANSSSNNIHIGKRLNYSSSTQQYTGYMDDLRIFNQALSVEQIIEISGFAKGSIIDSSGNGFNGNIKGLLTHLPGYTGNNNGGYRFPGNTSNLITLPSTIQDLVDNQMVARSFTISFWIKFRDTTTSVFNWILSFYTGDSINTNLHFYRNTDEKIGFDFYGNGAVSQNTIADSSWHHVVGTFTTGGPATNGVKVLYIDGKFEGRNAVGYPNLTGTPNFELGHFTNSFFSLDDFRIYNEALTSNEIMRLYTSYNPKGIKIMDSGNVGIGKNYPDCPLYIKNTSNDIDTTTVLASSGQSLLSMEQNDNIWRMSIGSNNATSDTTVDNLIFSSDLGTINKRGYIMTSGSYGDIIFTGQHRCLINKNIDSSFVGLIVSATSNYVNLDNSLQPTISESLPIVELSNIDNDSRVFGVLSQKENDSIVREHSSGNFVSIIDKANQNEQRFYVNSLGEGAIWVCNKNGALLNGEYVTSSIVNGYGVKQTLDVGLLTNFTVAKITCDCDFSINKIVKQKIKVENNQIEYDINGDIQFIDDLDSEGNQQHIYPFETRFIDSSGNQLLDESDYITRMANGEQVYIACFLGCTYHCG